ncbi:hypothetical protein L5G28_16370 [Gordonia sp. HY285]|uniref:hypothetical protein n=1 Tax=Gordonia liuliyuniae TaxID=2911517 RepID=UPI001F22CAA2|nr:hypothetical protein [Gordonia liuliyuniae]MCF8611722.1 hypothetical protein [Gordonia liuliyuniae]
MTYLSSGQAAELVGISAAAFKTHRRPCPYAVVVGEGTGRPVYGYVERDVLAWYAETYA